MKITDKLHKAEKEGRPFWSFEYFPPRTAQGLQNLFDRIERMRDLGPEFIDITWGAGGKNADLTNSLVEICQSTIGIETCMHLCCTEMPKEKVEWALKQAKQNGCQNILALRGDPVAGTSTWEPTPGGFMNAIDLVKYIHKNYPGDFCVAVAGFPQGHPESPLTPEGKEQEMKWLKEKVDAGADFIFTQMFYDTDIFFDWVKRVRAAGITVPIIPGIMPIQNWEKFDKWVQRENIIVPQHFYDALNPVKGDDEKVRQVGTKLVAEMCRKILDNKEAGIKGLHVYTLNLEKGARMLLQELGFEGRREQIAPLPWRPSLTPNRRDETIRPIFWANRTRSYISRTEDWDEFPNGRWGDSRSPAYGDLDGYPVSIGISATEAYNLWGNPTTTTEIYNLFARFCRGELTKLPWSTQPPASETSVITDQLTKMNELGYLTINSQPAVDGVASDDKVHGWGPSGGYVYQKAYLEFFVSPELLSPLIRRIERDPRITYYAVNKQGDLRTNTHSEGPNAVTWGVFPGKEIIQPTIVEAVSFVAWKDEAFELGLQWANLYPAGSPSRELITKVMNDSYLVNIVANDFRDGLSIFEPFLLDQTPVGKVVEGVKGVVEGVVEGVKSVVAE
ncbi:methylenetetrahydrofolate reductase [Cryptococcus amylolentus CBS 6039]|uniref:Methylenetetrahydrofolate reductase n=2 Tax=Cryptococcus amylolentus CBS 6039 TaxID=1295533 RepID=A0A1E3HXY0_9TREE|nr:methylenetetrahydrofolate reductase [Cryptococcus amylolentus CBS 6039]ODN80626.1 methylenetetrahydrofolate reductase [Cryptococcus amylolentus CBS 6039]